MNKLSKIVGTASLAGTMMVFAACGGGSGGSDAPVVIAPGGDQIISAASPLGIATTDADTFKLINADLAGYTATITSGFKYATDTTGDKISYPIGGQRPAAFPGGVNSIEGDGLVDLTWVSNGQEVMLHFTGLDLVTERVLVSSDDTAASYIYKTY